VAFIDVFNGDTDGSCALHQVRPHCPRDAVLVPGARQTSQRVIKCEVKSGFIGSTSKRRLT